MEREEAWEIKQTRMIKGEGKRRRRGHKKVIKQEQKGGRKKRRVEHEKLSKQE